ncbi:MAG: NAD-dependent protein deacylase [Clostridiales bacterium]|nr:NAD-dependent protein deacylase [Clostridiales bacterium]
MNKNYLEKIQYFQEILQKGNAVFFGGAGVSTESGIPDFRSTDGLYNQEYAYPPEQMVSHSFFVSNTAEFYRFYKNKMLFPKAEPNACHFALARLEQQGKLRAIVTQNIDGLHQKAGSKKVFELHGSVWRNNCVKCRKGYTLPEIIEKETVPHCDCGGIIKPDVVLYEEALADDVVMGAVRAISQADTLIVGGTSLVVYPAAGLLRYFNGEHLIVINRTPTDVDGRAELLFSENIGKVFADLGV